MLPRDLINQYDWANVTHSNREAGLHRLRSFLPYAGKEYAKNRNFDLGPSNRKNISGLSPYTRIRLVSEDDICEELLREQTPSEADKFLSEVCWRTYWKGYLELHPEIWKDYNKSLAKTLSTNEIIGEQYHKALSAQTGIECMDSWIDELKNTGYLHNHARMWFASIWVFTLKLPWQLGANFFLTHLIDGDPAVNTLSWRWVAGLHTKGKTYAARSSNITKYTNGRFTPDQGDFRSDCSAILEEKNLALTHAPITIENLPSTPKPEHQNFRLLITPDDLTGDLALKKLGRQPKNCAILSGDFFAQEPVSCLVKNWRTQAINSTKTRIEKSTECLIINTFEDLRTWISADPYTPVYYFRPFVGFSLDTVNTFLLENHEIQIHELRRTWDQSFFPLATGSFFKLKKRMLSNLRLFGYTD